MRCRWILMWTRRELLIVNCQLLIVGWQLQLLSYRDGFLMELCQFLVKSPFGYKYK